MRNLLCCAFLAVGFIVNGQTLHLYGGSDQDDYLGCLNCSNYDKNSIWNTYGAYGAAIIQNLFGMLMEPMEVNIIPILLGMHIVIRLPL